MAGVDAARSAGPVSGGRGRGVPGAAPGRARGTRLPLRVASGGVAVLAFAALLAVFVFEAPHVAWAAVLVAALLVVDIALGVGVRDWARDRSG